jgi:hypothetical protein
MTLISIDSMWQVSWGRNGGNFIEKTSHANFPSTSNTPKPAVSLPFYKYGTLFAERVSGVMSIKFNGGMKRYFGGMVAFLEGL